MPEEPITLELAKQLQATQEQLRSTMTELSGLTRLVSSAENERSLMRQMWTLQEEVKGLRKEVNTFKSHATVRGDRGWQIATIVLAAVVSAAVTFSTSVLKSPAPTPTPTPQPSLPFDEPLFPPGEGEPQSQK